MKRRNALQSLLGIPALTALPSLAQEPPAQRPQPAPIEEFPKLTTISPDAAVDGVPGFFTPRQYANLVRLAEALVPAASGKPGAIEAEVPAFLDFLLSESPPPRQTLYRDGLDHLDAASHQQLAELLAPLRAPLDPGDPFSVFLHTAKDDMLRATFNSRQWAAASNQRRAGGLGTYWHAID